MVIQDEKKIVNWLAAKIRPLDRKVHGLGSRLQGRTEAPLNPWAPTFVPHEKLLEMFEDGHKEPAQEDFEHTKYVCEPTVFLDSDEYTAPTLLGLILAGQGNMDPQKALRQNPGDVDNDPKLASTGHEVADDPNKVVTLNQVVPGGFQNTDPEREMNALVRICAAAVFAEDPSTQERENDEQVNDTNAQAQERMREHQGQVNISNQVQELIDMEPGDSNQLPEAANHSLLAEVDPEQDSKDYSDDNSKQASKNEQVCEQGCEPDKQGDNYAKQVQETIAQEGDDSKQHPLPRTQGQEGSEIEVETPERDDAGGKKSDEVEQRVRDTEQKRELVAMSLFQKMLQDDPDMSEHRSQYCDEFDGAGIHRRQSAFVFEFLGERQRRRNAGFPPYVMEGQWSRTANLKQVLENIGLKQSYELDSEGRTLDAPPPKKPKRKRKRKAKQERGPEGDALDCEEDPDADDAQAGSQEKARQETRAEEEPKEILPALSRAGLESDRASMQHWRAWSKLFRAGKDDRKVRDEETITAFMGESMRKRRAGLPPYVSR